MKVIEKFLVVCFLDACWWLFDVQFPHRRQSFTKSNQSTNIQENTKLFKIVDNKKDLCIVNAPTGNDINTAWGANLPLPL